MYYVKSSFELVMRLFATNNDLPSFYLSCLGLRNLALFDEPRLLASYDEPLLSELPLLGLSRERILSFRVLEAIHNPYNTNQPLSAEIRLSFVLTKAGR